MNWLKEEAEMGDGQTKKSGKWDTAVALFHKGQRLKEQGDYGGAVTAYTEALALVNTANTHNQRGLAYKKMGDYENAIDDFTQAIFLKEIDAGPEEIAGSYINRGMAYFETEQNDKAIADAEEAIKRGCYLGRAYNLRGIVYDDMGKFQQAIEDYKKAIAHGSTEAKENLRELEQYLGDNGR